MLGVFTELVAGREKFVFRRQVGFAAGTLGLEGFDHVADRVVALLAVGLPFRLVGGLQGSTEGAGCFLEPLRAVFGDFLKSLCGVFGRSGFGGGLGFSFWGFGRRGFSGRRSLFRRGFGVLGATADAEEKDEGEQHGVFHGSKIRFLARDLPACRSSVRRCPNPISIAF